MSNSRRQFLNRASAALMAAAAACRKPAPRDSAALPPGAPPAFGTAPDVGPPVSPATFAEAEKLVQFELSAAERQIAAGNWRKTMAPLYERRTGPRKVSPPPSVAPASRWDPVLPGQNAGARPAIASSVPQAPPGPLPANDAGHRLRPAHPVFRAGSRRASSPPSASPASISTAWSASTPSCAASSR